jgi:hypothetical protein
MRRPYECLAEQSLLDRLDAVAARDRQTTAEMIGLIAEVELRRLYAQQGYSSMHAYCVKRLVFSDDMAFKRIRAARKSLRFPQIVAGIASGRLHLSGVVMLCPCLTQDNADELLSAAEGLTRNEIERLIAERFPQPDVPARIVPVAVKRVAERAHQAVQAAATPLAPAPGSTEAKAADAEPSDECAAPPFTLPVATADRHEVAGAQLAPGPVRTLPERGRITPLSAKRSLMTVTIGDDLEKMLEYLKSLLSHQVPDGDLERILEHMAAAAIVELERRKFAATDRPRAARPTTSERHIPAHVMRVVAKRDGKCCTYVSPEGVRCDSRSFLEYDHIVPVAKGGRATVDNIRQRCRAHNQYDAERVFGRSFVEAKREEATARAGEGAGDRAGVATAPATRTASAPR